MDANEQPLCEECNVAVLFNQAAIHQVAQIVALKQQYYLHSNSSDIFQVLIEIECVDIGSYGRCQEKVS